MKRKRLTEEQIIGVLKENEAGAKVDDICRRHAISSATFYAWRKKYGGLEASEAKRLKELEVENAKLKWIVADQMLDMSAMKELLQKHWSAHGQTQSHGLSDGRDGPERTPQLPDCWITPVRSTVSAGAEERSCGDRADEGVGVGEP